MKSKKLALAVVALTMSATTAVSFAGCHEHEYKWTTKTPATCNTAGEEEGVCDCGATTTRTVEAKGHAYGDWKISKTPTPNASGTAVKVCVNDNGCDVVSVDLPKLTKDGSGYDDYKETATDYGVPIRTYTLNNGDRGNVVMDLSVAFTLDEAVKLAVHNQSKAVGADVLRDAKLLATLNNPYVNPDLIPAEDKIVPPDWEGYFYAHSTTSITYEKSENYVGLIDNSEKVNRFYTRNDDGSIFAVLEKFVGGGQFGVYEYEYELDNNGDPLLDQNGNPIIKYDSEGNPVNKLDSSGNPIPVLDEDGNQVMRDIPVEKYIIKDPDTNENLFNGSDFYFLYYHGDPTERCYGVADFIYTLYSYASNDINDDFTPASESLPDGSTKWSFTYGAPSTETTMEESLCLFDVSFVLNADGLITDADVECKTFVGNKFIDRSESGKLTIKDGKEDCWKNYEHYTVKQSASYEDDKVPANPYNYDDMLVTDFDVTIGTAGNYNPLTGTYVIKAIAPDNGVYRFNPDTSLAISISNVAPADTHNLYFDELHFMLYDAKTGEFVEEITMDQNRSSEGHFDGQFNSHDKILLFKSFLAGEYKLVLKTTNVTKEIMIDVSFIAPTDFAPNVYSYDEINEKATWVPAAIDKEVYAGQSIAFNSVCGHPFYEDKSFTVEVTDASGATVTADVMSDGVVEGENVSIFKATNAGVYTVTLHSNTGDVQTSFVVTVNEAPAIGDFLSGNYSNGDAGVAAAFVPSASSATDGTVEININGNVINASYAYDDATKKVNLTDLTGATDGYVDLHFEITEAYNMFMVYENAMGKETKVYVVKGTVNNLLGDHAMASTQDDAETLVCNVPGTYTVKVSKSGMVFYKVNGELKYMMSGTTFKVTLNEGDELKVWTTMGVPTYTITLDA